MNTKAFTISCGLLAIAVGCHATDRSRTTPTAPAAVQSATPLAFGPAPPVGLHAHTGAAHAPHGAAVSAEPRIVELQLTPEIDQQLSRLRSFAAPFHNFEKALDYGYSIPAPGPGVCIADPARGGMGYHYTFAHQDLIGDGKVDVLEPEFLVYSPKENGGVRFSALDYFVPYTTWPHAEPPSLLGIPFAREDGFQAYVLHIWLFWHNPAGMFENFNPAVPLC